MGYVKGEAPGQSSLFPPSLDELVPEDHPVRVIAAFVELLARPTIRPICSNFPEAAKE